MVVIINSMELQEYFDKTINHLRQQEARAYSNGACRYLALDGNKCAVGLHIPDGHPAQHYEGSIETLIDDYPSLAGVAWPEGINGVALASLLQFLHDSIIYRNEEAGSLSPIGECEAQSIAKRFQLVYTPPEDQS